MKRPPMSEWIGTFGCGQTLEDGTPLAGKFVRIQAATAQQARDQMVERFGRNWSFLYASEDLAGVRRHGLTELVEVRP